MNAVVIMVWRKAGELVRERERESERARERERETVSRKVNLREEYYPGEAIFPNLEAA